MEPDDPVAIDCHCKRTPVFAHAGKATPLNCGKTEQARDRIHAEIARTGIGRLGYGEVAKASAKHEIRFASHKTGGGDGCAVMSQVDRAAAQFGRAWRLCFVFGGRGLECNLFFGPARDHERPGRQLAPHDRHVGLRQQITVAMAKPMSVEARAHLAETMDTLNEALKAPMQRAGT